MGFLPGDTIAFLATEKTTKTGVRLPACASADRHAGSRAVRLPAGSVPWRRGASETDRLGYP